MKVKSTYRNRKPFSSMEKMIEVDLESGKLADLVKELVTKQTKKALECFVDCVTVGIVEDGIEFYSDDWDFSGEISIDELIRQQDTTQMFDDEAYYVQNLRNIAKKIRDFADKQEARFKKQTKK